MTLRDIAERPASRKHNQAKAEIERKPKQRKTEVVSQITDSLADDRLDGALAIARFIGIKPEHSVYPKLVNGHIPHVREGDKYVGSKARLRKHYQGE